MKKIILCLLLMGCSGKQNKVFLVKQWHLSPEASTFDIEKSKNLPQYQNQKAIFLWAKDKIEKGDTEVIIAEGCQGELTKDYKEDFNSWTMKKLISLKEKKYFIDILAPVPMKLKALFPQLKVICGDNLELIKNNLSAASEMRGFFGFYRRLLEAKKEGNKQVYQAYSKKIKSLFPHLGAVDELEFTKKKLKEAIEAFEVILLERNKYFLNSIKKYKEKNPILIIGGLHVKDLADSLAKYDIDYKVIVPEGYDNSEQSLLEDLKNLFNSREVSHFMVPEKFNLSHFNFNNQLPPFTDKSIRDELKKLTKENNLPEELILSDYDGDGIRDFTLSTSREHVILSAEDQDWDNDGVHNLEDESLGKVTYAAIRKTPPLINNYMTEVDEKKLLKDIQKNFVLIQQQAHHHEVLILEVILQLVRKLKLNFKGIKYIQSAELSHSYGKNAFFQYTQVSQTMSYDTAKLYQYVKKEFGKFTRYDKDLSFKKFINSYVIPLLIHSLSHEVAHSLDFDLDDYLKAKGWHWKLEPITNDYLSKYRHPKKKLTSLKKDIKFKGRTYPEWMELAKTADNPLNKLKIPSLYSLSKPGEWFAEVYAMCVFNRAYPGAVNEGLRYEQLLGINPAAVKKAECANFGP